jgi:hypothetical protein
MAMFRFHFKSHVGHNREIADLTSKRREELQMAVRTNAPSGGIRGIERRILDRSPRCGHRPGVLYWMPVEVGMYRCTTTKNMRYCNSGRRYQWFMIPTFNGP